MKVVILYSGRYPGFSAGAKRIKNYQEGLQLLGVEVKVHTPFIVPRNMISSILLLAINPIKIFWHSIFKFHSVDIVFIYGYSWLSIISLSLVRLLYGYKLVLEINEKPGSPYGNRFTEIRLVKIINDFLFKYSTIKLFNGFIVISKKLEEYVKLYKTKKSTILRIPIIINNNEMSRDVKNQNLPDFFILHCGALSERKDGIIGVFKAFALATISLNYELHFYLTSQTAPKATLDSINKIIRENKLENVVHFIKNLSEDELLAYQKQSRLVIINKLPNEQNEYNFPTKLGEYLAIGTPIIATNIGEMNNYLIHEYNAIILRTFNPEEIAETIIKIVKGEININDIKINGINLARSEFDHLNQCKKIVNYFQNLVR